MQLENLIAVIFVARRTPVRDEVQEIHDADPVGISGFLHYAIDPRLSKLRARELDSRTQRQIAFGENCKVHEEIEFSFNAEYQIPTTSCSRMPPRHP